MTYSSLQISIVEGKMVPILGNDIDTDRIVPARFLKEVTFDKMGDYLFYDARFTDGEKNTDHPLNQTQFSEASIMLVENNFGCGSSREHAPQAIKRAGFNAIIGESFAEIFSGNCKALGIVTLTLPSDELAELLQLIKNVPHENVHIDLNQLQLKLTSNNAVFSVKMKESHRSAFLNGTWDELSLLKLNNKKIDELVEKLPYFHW